MRARECNQMIDTTNTPPPPTDSESQLELVFNLLLQQKVCVTRTSPAATYILLRSFKPPYIFISDCSKLIGYLL